MKKKIIALLVAVIAIFGIAALAACDEEEKADRTAPADVTINSSIVFTASSDVMTITGTTSVKDYLDALKDDGQIDYDGYESDYGFYITSVFGLEEVAYSCYWILYTDLYTYDNVTYATVDYGTYEVNGKTLGSASYGVSYIPCVEGYTYALVYTTY